MTSLFGDDACSAKQVFEKADHQALIKINNPGDEENSFVEHASFNSLVRRQIVIIISLNIL